MQATGTIGNDENFFSKGCVKNWSISFTESIHLQGNTATHILKLSRENKKKENKINVTHTFFSVDKAGSDKQCVLCSSLLFNSLNAVYPGC